MEQPFLFLIAFIKVIGFFYFPHGANRKVLRHEARTTLEGRRYRQPPEPEMETVVQNPQFAKFASLYFKEGPCHKLLTNYAKKIFYSFHSLMLTLHNLFIVFMSMLLHLMLARFFFLTHDGNCSKRNLLAYICKMYKHISILSVKDIMHRDKTSQSTIGKKIEKRTIARL